MKVIIVGGGIMGMSIAVELRRAKDIDVVVVEKSAPGAASALAAGMLAPQFEGEVPGPMLDLSLLSRMAWPKFAAELVERSGLDFDYRASGGLLVAFSEDEVHALDAKIAWQVALGLRGELLSGPALREQEARLSPQAIAAAHFPDEHQVDPRRLMKALTVAAERAGVQVRSGSVQGLTEKEGTVCGVELEGERLEADVVVLSAGAWSGLVAGAGVDPARVKPVRGQLIELQLPAPIFSRILKSANGYVVSRSDGSVLAGSTMEMVGFDKSVTVGGLSKILSGAVELIPELAGAPVINTWAGLRPWSDAQLPFLGEGPKPGLLLATGHFRNGILLAPITARLIGQLIRREKTSVDLRPFRYSRNSP